MKRDKMPYNVIVLVKQIPDIDQMKTDPSTGEPILQNLPLRVENLSKNAIEAAVKIKEKHGGKVSAIIFGTDKSSAAMKESYAMGVDEGFLLTGYDGNHPEVTAKVLAEKIKTVPHDLVILGNQSADSYTGLLPGKISAITGEPLLGNAIKIEMDGKTAKVTSALEEYNLEIMGETPAIISVAQEINEPRLPPVLQIMAAGRKPINTQPAGPKEKFTSVVISNKAPKSDRKRIVFEDVDKGVAEVSKAIKEAIR